MKTLRSELITLGHFAALAGVCRQTAYRWVYTGKIDSVMRGGRHMIPIYEINRMLAIHKPGGMGRHRKKPDLPVNRERGFSKGGG